MDDRNYKPTRRISEITNQKQESSQFDIENYIKENFSKEIPKVEQKTYSFRYTASDNKSDGSLDLVISTNKLRDIIIWTEILGKPVSKRKRIRL